MSARGRPTKQKRRQEEAEAADEEATPPARYECAFQDEEEGGGFAPPELVWCKVRSHPWWPAQVFDAADASELALRHARDGGGAQQRRLVAYFWDRTFAWTSGDSGPPLLPFRANFARLADQNTVASFTNAVDAALQEIGRRVETGLLCACSSVAEIKKQEVENSGVREGAHGAVVDGAYMREAFRGQEFLRYISALARNPLAGADRLDLAIARAQLRSFNRSRGPRDLPEFVAFGGIEDEATEEAVPSTKRKRMDKSDVSSKDKKSRSNSNSNSLRKKEDLTEPAKKEAIEVDNSVPSAVAKDDTSNKGRKPKDKKSSANKEEDASKDVDELETVGDGKMLDKEAVDGALSQSRSGRAVRSSRKVEEALEGLKGLAKAAGGEVINGGDKDPGLLKENNLRHRVTYARKKGKITEDGDGHADGGALGSLSTGKKASGLSLHKEKAVPESAKKETMDSRGATEETLGEESKSKRRKSSAKKNEETSEDADGLESVGGSTVPDNEAVDNLLSESKSGRMLRSTSKIGEALEGLKVLGKAAVGETIQGEEKLKENNLGRRATSARKKAKAPERSDGPADGSAKGSPSSGKKSPGHGGNSETKKDHGIKRKKLSELLAETCTPDSAPGKSKARGKRSLDASTEKLEDRDSMDTVKTRRRKMLNTLGESSSQSQPLSPTKSTNVEELMHKPTEQKSQSQTPPVLKGKGAASQTKSRRSKHRQVTVAEKSPHSVEPNLGKKDAFTEDSLSCREMLSQLSLAARDFKKIQEILPTSVSFFTDFMKSSYGCGANVEEEAPKKAANTDCFASSSHVDDEIHDKATTTEPTLSEQPLPIPEKATATEPTPSVQPLADHMKDDYWADILVNAAEPISSLKKKKDKVKRRTSKKERDAEDLAKKSALSPGQVEETPEKVASTGCCASGSHVDEVVLEKATSTEPTPSVQPLPDHMQDSFWADILVNVEGRRNVEEPKAEGKQYSENGKRLNIETKANVVNGAQLNADTSLLAGLVLHFSRPSAVPSRSELIKIFSQYGPVIEAKTEIANNANCAQVIFKRRMDAEAAFPDVGKISALGPALVSFRLTDFPAAVSGNEASVNEKPSLAGLVLYFSTPDALPSCSDLINIFSQYGPVNKAKTEIANNANCAQVIFKKRVDAESAFAGVGKISALGPALINFRLAYFPAAA